MTAVTIVIIVGGIVALTVLTWFIARLYAQQQRAEERVLGLMTQLSMLVGLELPPTGAHVTHWVAEDGEQRDRRRRRGGGHDGDLRDPGRTRHAR